MTFIMNKYSQWLLILLFGVFDKAMAQNAFSGLENLFSTPEHYLAGYTSQLIRIDGNINEAAWETAAWSNTFQDIEGDKQPRPALQTRMKMLWNDTCLYIAAELQDPHIWATLKQHDDIVFRDNDFEVFIDPNNNTHQYYEIEINALNTIFDLFMPKPYRNGSGAMINWNQAGLQSAVHIKGTLNKPADRDSLWTVEMAMPFHSLNFNSSAMAPAIGEIWRINFSRVEWDTEIQDGKYIKSRDSSGRPKPERNWVWSPQGVVNMHFPERWGYLQFVKQKEGVPPAVFEMPYVEKQKRFLWLCYYRQKEYAGRNGKYAFSLKELGIDSMAIKIDGHVNTLNMEATTLQFTTKITDENKNAVSINDEGLIWYFKNR
jgi:hypothetical protein